MDATVLGAGVFGLCAAYALAQRGLRVRVVDSGGVAAGSSGGIVGALAPHVPERWNPKKAHQFDSLIAAEAYWSGVAEISGMETGYARLGRLQPVADDAALGLAQARAEESRTLWQGKAEWRVIRAADAGDFAPVSPSGYLIHDTLTARLHPRLACAALATAVERLGGEITNEAEVQGVVVHATGWQGLLELSEAFEKPVGAGVKGQAALLEYMAGQVPQLFADGVHIVPHADGTVAIGSTSEREFSDGAATDEQLDDLVSRAIRICPALKGAPVLERWAGVRPRAKTRSPMVGAWPDRPGHYVANGGFKIGFAMAPVVAGLLADLIVDDKDGIPDGFRVEASL